MPQEEEKAGKNTKPATKGKLYRKGKGFKKSKPERPKDEDPKIKFNPVEWYTKYKTLADEATKLGFNHIKGSRYESALDGSGPSLPTNPINDSLFANIRYIVTPGIIKDASAGFTMQIRKLYLAMKRKYRGLNTYQVADLGVTLFCIADFYRAIAKLERIYGAFNYFNVKNRSIPKYLGALLRVKQDNIQNNLADFRAGINRLITKAKSLCLPKGLDVINRWMFLESNIFKDSEDPRAMYLLFDDDNLFYTYQPTWSSNGGSAVLTDVTAARTDPNFWEYDELLNFASDMLDLLLEDDDITLQLGDIVSYFTQPSGNVEVLTLDYLPEDYVVVPTYNPDIALQIHNAQCVGSHSLVTEYADRYSSITSSNFDVGKQGSLKYYEGGTTGNNGFIFMDQVSSNPMFGLKCSNAYETTNHHWGFSSKKPNAKIDMNWKAGNMILDTWKDVPTPDDIMEMTRFCLDIFYKKASDGGVTYHDFDVRACGSEVIRSIFVSSTMGFGYTTVINTIAHLNNNESSDFQQYAYITKMDWRPLRYYLSSFSTTNEDSNFSVGAWVDGDLDNARVLNSSDLDFIHDAAIMSLFEISSVQAFKEK